MKTRLYFSLFTVIILFWAGDAVSQSFGPEKVITPVGFDISKKLTDIPQIPPAYVDRSWKEKVIPNQDGFQEEFKLPSQWIGPDPVLQDNLTDNPMQAATIGKNFAGMSNTSGVAPPDTDGDVSPNYFVQMVNLSFQVFDKNGTSLYGPVPSSTLWNGFNGPWSGTNDGDPIVLYDQYADRWIATQFSLPNYPSGPFYELIAVSTTNDPRGSWYRYAYEFSNMPDYPKFGVWPDGYYMTINQFAPPSLSFAGAGVCVFNRASMVSGSPTAQMLFFTLSSYSSLLPADVDGSSLPPAGTPNYLANLGTNSLRIFKATVDWANTNNSSVSLMQTLTVQSYSYSNIVINQPGTSQTLDPLASRLMFRLQYRNFGTYEVMLTNHTVNANGSGQAGVRWYELRKTGSSWTVYQQGTYAPADGNDRWMASVAMNGSGDIGIGYSVSSSTTYPSIRVAGQSAANSGTGILDVNETSIFEGSVSQTGVSRWGDYSMMAVDPTNDATFWYTTEYSNGGWNWKTRIASFTVAPPVVIAPVADFSGTPLNIMAGQQVSFTDLSGNNPTSYAWSFPGGTPSTSTEKNPVVNYPATGDYSVTLTATNSAGSSTITKTNYIHVTAFVATYCVSSGTNTSREWINSVGIGTYNNPSGSNNGYGDFTGDIIELASGSAYNLTLSPGFSGKSRLEYWRVWIDYNMDGDFLDNGELVYSADAQKVSLSGSVTIPANLTGQTRMRVSMKYNAAPTSCEQFTYGEVEDYTLSLFVPTPAAPVADFSGSPTTVVEGNSVQFTDLSTNSPTSWAWIFDGGTPGTSTAQNPVVTYTSTGSFGVSLTATNGVGSNTKTVAGYITVTLTGTYCASHSNSNALDWIAGIAIGSFSHPSEASLYSDYTATSVGLVAGSAYNVTLTPHSATQRNFWRVWIDFNGDGDFDDTGEQVFAANNKKGIATGTLTIPSGASGSTRMRVSMKVGGAPTSCEIFADGEVEDYTASFTSAPAAASQDNPFKIDVYPNPATNQVNVVVHGSEGDVNIKVYSPLGQVLENFNIAGTRTTIDLGGYRNGLYYIGAEDGKSNAMKKVIKQ